MADSFDDPVFITAPVVTLTALSADVETLKTRVAALERENNRLKYGCSGESYRQEAV